MATIVVEVCAGTHCTMLGAMNVMDAIHSLEELRGETPGGCAVEVRAVPCMNLCGSDVHGPFVRVDGALLENAQSEAVMAAIMVRCGRPAEG